MRLQCLDTGATQVLLQVPAQGSGTDRATSTRRDTPPLTPCSLLSLLTAASFRRAMLFRGPSSFLLLPPPWPWCSPAHHDPLTRPRAASAVPSSRSTKFPSWLAAAGSSSPQPRQAPWAASTKAFRDFAAANMQEEPGCTHWALASGHQLRVTERSQPCPLQNCLVPPQRRQPAAAPVRQVTQGHSAQVLSPCRASAGQSCPAARACSVFHQLTALQGAMAKLAPSHTPTPSRAALGADCLSAQPSLTGTHNSWELAPASGPAARSTTKGQHGGDWHTPPTHRRVPVLQ